MRQLSKALLLLLLFSQAFAGIESELKDFFSDSGIASNINKPTAARTQQGGFYSGGSAYVRSPVKYLQLANIQLPEIKAGCAGIDIVTGGISYINGKQLIEFGQAVLQNGAGFAVQLALQIWAPTLKSNLDYFIKLAQDINNFNMDSCETGQMLIGELAGTFATGDAKKEICKMYSTHSGKWKDRLSARDGCNDSTKTSVATEVAKNNPDFDPAIKDLIKEKRNIIWYALMKNKFLYNNPDIAELVMSISGTMVYGETLNEKKYHPAVLNSANSDLIKSMLYGGDVASFLCKDKGKNLGESCLTVLKEGDPGFAPKKITPEKSLRHLMYLHLKAIGEKYKAAVDIDMSEVNIVEHSSVSLLKIIVNYIDVGMVPPYEELADLTARDFLHNYLMSLSAVLKTSLAASANAGDDKDYDKMINNLQYAEHIIRGIKREGVEQLKIKMYLHEEARAIEQQVAARVAALQGD